MVVFIEIEKEMCFTSKWLNKAFGGNTSQSLVTRLSLRKLFSVISFKDN
jgi:hypothetical protein